jgi:acyl carrier protein
MAPSDFLDELSKILDVNREDISPDLELDSCQWDSIAAFQFITSVDLFYDLKVEANALRHCSTVADLLSLVPS